MDLLNIIKKAALDAVKESQPCDVLFGKIISVSPLQINIDQKFTLTSEFLILTRTMQNNCNIGERVIVLKVQGGQKYVVVDRI